MTIKGGTPVGLEVGGVVPGLGRVLRLLGFPGGGGLRAGFGALGNIDQDFEGLREVAAYLVVVVDVDLAKQRLIAEAFADAVAEAVEGVAVLEKVGCVGEVLLGALILGVAFCDLLADLFELVADAVLLADELVQVDRVGEVQFEELVLLAGEPVAGTGELGEFLRGRGVVPVEVIVDSSPERTLHRRRGLDNFVVVGDELLDQLDRYGAAGAGGATRVAAGADEVRVN